MEQVLNNPYRILGVLAGASAKEVTRQTNRLRKYLAAGQEPPADDYSFSALGKLTRTVESVADAAAKLNLDADRMDAALFWFWKGNEITDEPALEALKEGDIVTACQIWEKMIRENGCWKPVTEKNLSAFHNYSIVNFLPNKEVKTQTLTLAEFKKMTGETHLRQCYSEKKGNHYFGLPKSEKPVGWSRENPPNRESCWFYYDEERDGWVASSKASGYRNISVSNTAVIANIYFLESDYFSEFVKATVDATYKVSKKEIELKFLETIMSNNISVVQLVIYLKEYDFAAKQDFLKSVSQKFTANINAQIETARKNRTTNKQQAAAAGETLYKNTKDDLAQLKEIFGEQDFSYSNVADNVANEILQCSIDFFNDSQEKELDNDYHEEAMNLATIAQQIAAGNLAKGRIADNLKTLEGMQFKAIQVLKLVKQAYENLAAENIQLRMYGQYKTINETAVIELIHNGITQRDVDLIKNSDNQERINEYKILVNYVCGELSSYYQSEVSYLKWWVAETSRVTTSKSINTHLQIPSYIPILNTNSKEKWYDNDFSDFVEEYIPWYNYIYVAHPSTIAQAFGGRIYYTDTWINDIGWWALLLWPVWVVHFSLSFVLVIYLHLPFWLIYYIVKYVTIWINKYFLNN